MSHPLSGRRVGLVAASLVAGVVPTLVGAPVQAAPAATPIADIQGTGGTSPLVDDAVTTTGVVTAAYPTGGFDGVYLQTPGTGDVDLATHQASTGLFVYSAELAGDVKIGDHVQVSGTVKEFKGLTELAADDAGWEVLDEPAEQVKPARVAFPIGEAQRESLEGMVVAPQGDYTVTNNYATNSFGEVGLASGTEPLHQPTDVVAPRTPAYAGLVAENARRLITLDDGASNNFLFTDTDVPLPWLTPSNEVRVGSRATLTQPLVLDYRFGWKLQPTSRLTGAGDPPATFSSTRQQRPADVGGQVRLASFNVLNLFPTTGEMWTSSGQGTCTYNADRSGRPVTTKSCTNDGPRGAADDASLGRQRTKIVNALDTLDADVVVIQELENSARLGQPRDAALDALVAALNTKVGSDRWAAVPSPATVPTTGSDVIRTALIYQRDAIESVGGSTILDDPAFVNARAPLAQTFRPKGSIAASDFLVVANHFKSKGSGTGADVDQKDGQGASNASRVEQATALTAFAADRAAAAGTDRVFLAGDFNSYAKEDPVGVIEDAGYTNVSDERSGKDTYQYDGLVGSLDHVFASAAATRRVRGADVWQINSPESVAREYSRYDANVTNLYDESPFRASDHDPSIVGFDADPAAADVSVRAPGSVRLGQSLSARVTVRSGGAAAGGRVTLSEGARTLADAALVDGSATLSVGSGGAEGLGVGTHDLVLRYSGTADVGATEQTVRVDVLKSLTTLALASTPLVWGSDDGLTVTSSPATDGLLVAAVGDEVVGWGSIGAGRGDVDLDWDLIEPGTHRVSVYSSGDPRTEPAAVTGTLVITKAASKVTTTAPTGKIVIGRSRAVVGVRVTAPGFAPTGTVVVSYGGKELARGRLASDGTAKIRLPVLRAVGTRTFTVTYSGDAHATASTGSVRVKTVRR